MSHICVFSLSLISFLLNYYDFSVFSRALDWLSILFYQGSIFYTQSQFFKAEDACSEQMPNLHKWFLVEIITFYGFIISAVLFIFLGALFKFKDSFFFN